MMTFTNFGVAFGALAFVIYILDFHARRKRGQVHSYIVEGSFVFVTTLAWGCVLQTGDEPAVARGPSIINERLLPVDHAQSNFDNPPPIIDHPYVASSIKGIYHRADCRYATTMEHARHYDSAADAQADGKQPCKVCLPVLEVASLKSDGDEQ